MKNAAMDIAAFFIAVLLTGVSLSVAEYVH
ncbi:hypothetical protein ACOMICROBIO_LMKGKHOH_04571 [Vibrio sp. B1FIG11]|nr:hypothetical protein ACOMICROBIO_LMKGKHOH_04571 [Vibrio sp. B1FIG11]CAE6940789.1 hypothetical protein ACOMICROBIO_LMKGKHOH_04571 [Vibrio sp. B1FIG11]